VAQKKIMRTLQKPRKLQNVQLAYTVNETFKMKFYYQHELSKHKFSEVYTSILNGDSK
jgi:hypothetical protein